MADYPDLSEGFSNGLSIAARIAGMHADQKIAKQNADTSQRREGDASAAELATRPGRMRDVDSQSALRDAQADWYTSRGAALDAGKSRPDGKLASWDMRTLTTRLGALEKLKTYGADYFGAGQDAEYMALQGEYNKRLGIQPVTPPAPPPGMMERLGSGIGNFARNLAGSFHRSPEQPAATAPAPADDGGMIKVRNRKTGQPGKIPKANYNAAAYEQLGQ